MSSIFIIWVSLLPLIVFKGGYEGPKVFCFLMAGAFIIFFWITKLFKDPEALKVSKIDKWYLLWLLVLTVSSIFGIHPLQSILGGSYRHQGVLFFLTLWLTGKTIQLLGEKQKKNLMQLVGGVILTECAIVTYQYFSGRLYFGKALGTLGEANAVAGYLAMGMYFIYQSFPKRFLLLPSILILISGSRSGIISLAVFLTTFLRNFKFRFKKIITPSIILLLATLILVVSISRGPSPFEDRGLIWELGVNKILERPILGWGAESGEALYDIAFYQIHIPLFNLIVDRAHSLVLDILMWSGVAGLIFFVKWLYLSYKEVDSEKKIAILTFIVYSLFQPLSVVHWVLFMILISSH